MTDAGFQRRWARIFKGERTLILPVDDRLISGADVSICILEKPHVDAILCYPGLLKYYNAAILHLPIIINLTGSTTRSGHVRKVALHTVEDAIRFDASAVAVHINLTSDYESEMLQVAAVVAREAGLLSLPIMMIVYPRREGPNGVDIDYEDLCESDPAKYTALLTHCLLVAEDLGADICKIRYTHEVPDIIASAMAKVRLPVVIAGGPRRGTEAELLVRARTLMDAGAAGLCFGRNIYTRPDPARVSEALYQVVHS